MMNLKQWGVFYALASQCKQTGITTIGVGSEERRDVIIAAYEELHDFVFPALEQSHPMKTDGEK